MPTLYLKAYPDCPGKIYVFLCVFLLQCIINYDLKLWSRVQPQEGCGGFPHPEQLACQHIYRISIVLVNILLLLKLKEGPICRQTGLERSQFVGKLGLCTPPINLYCFTPGCCCCAGPICWLPPTSPIFCLQYIHICVLY